MLKAWLRHPFYLFCLLGSVISRQIFPTAFLRSPLAFGVQISELPGLTVKAGPCGFAEKKSPP